MKSRNRQYMFFLETTMLFVGGMMALDIKVVTVEG